MEVLNEFETYVLEQIFISPIPPYKPQQYTGITERDFHCCIDCGDRYILESSLKLHLMRESVAITYFCRHCDRSLEFKNRCNLLSHLRGHPVASKSSLSVVIKPLPVNCEKRKTNENISSKSNGIIYSSVLCTPIQFNKSILIKKNDSPVSEPRKEETVKIISIKPGEVNIVVSEKTEELNLLPKLAKCEECEIEVENISEHFLGNMKQIDPKVRCQNCDLICPTKCCLKAHQRIHSKKLPYICPDCMKKFTMFESFMVHLQYSCFHLDKCSRFKCEVCADSFTSLTVLEVHLATKHVKPVYKCFSCPRAFFELSLLNDHKIQSHGDARIPTKFFEQCQLCPQKLVTKSNLFIHIHEHVMNKMNIFYCYKCSECHFYTDEKSKFALHRIACPVPGKDTSGCAMVKLSKSGFSVENDKFPLTHPKKQVSFSFQNGTNNQITNADVTQMKGIDKNFLKPSSKLNILNRKVGKGLNAYKQLLMISKERKSHKSINCKRGYQKCSWHPKKCPMCQNEISCRSPSFQNNCKSSYLGCDKWKEKKRKLVGINEILNNRVSKFNKSSEKNYMAFNGPSYKLKNVASPYTSETYLCHLCKCSIQMEHAMIQKHFRQQHPDIEMMSLFPLMKKIYLPKIPIGNIKFTVKKSKVYQRLIVNDSKKMTLLKRNASKEEKQILKARKNMLQKYRKATISTVRWLLCPKCKFKTKNKKTLRKHINSHKRVLNQCPECDLQFSVEHLLKKHLILNHGATELNAEKNVEKLNNELSLASGLDSSDENVKCKVCHKSFGNTHDLQKHFRLHGMAFLLLNKDEKVWRKV